MSIIQNYPGALIFSLLLWLIFSVCFCLFAGYMANRLRRRRREANAAWQQRSHREQRKSSPDEPSHAPGGSRYAGPHL